MVMKDKKILVVGLGVSGMACIKGLSKLGAEIYVYDGSSREKLSEKLEELNGISAKYYFGDEEFDVNDIDFAIKSPGIKYETDIIQKLIDKNKKIISDIEAAYLVTEGTIVSISGTNGKTTTTTLIGEIVRESGKKYKVTGNIGYGMFLDSLNAEKGEILVAETSSFQLAGTYEYKPHISILTNITPDHLDFHHTLENYIEAKFKNVINQDENDFAILNYEDEAIRRFSDKIKAKKIFFSSERELEEGVFVQNGKIIYRENGKNTVIMEAHDIFIPGKHNLENALAAAGSAIALNIEPEVIQHILKEFKGVEHRLEYSGEYKGIKFYNDSKGTNPEQGTVHT
mgnify:FL=1